MVEHVRPICKMFRVEFNFEQHLLIDSVSRRQVKSLSSRIDPTTQIRPDIPSVFDTAQTRKETRIQRLVTKRDFFHKLMQGKRRRNNNEKQQRWQNISLVNHLKETDHDMSYLGESEDNPHMMTQNQITMRGNNSQGPSHQQQTLWFYLVTPTSTKYCTTYNQCLVISIGSK